jgi:hypothetical protein
MTCLKTCSNINLPETASFQLKNYDSGISIAESVTSSLIDRRNIDRINDWLTNTGIASEQNTPSSFKTTVAYFLPGENTPYLSTFNGKHLTLAQFKQLLTRKGNFRYFFKTKTDLLDGECSTVYQEINDDFLIVPLYNNKVIAKIEKSNE